jgi:hypothetical protein
MASGKVLWAALVALVFDRSFWARIGVALVCFTLGIGYLFIPAVKNDPPRGLQYVGHWWVTVYAVGWILAGLIAVTLAVAREPGPIWRVWCWIPCAVWSAAYGAGWLAYRDLSWRACLLYAGVCLMMFAAVRTPPRGGWRVSPGDSDDEAPVSGQCGV